MYYLGCPADAFDVMRTLGSGISEHDYESFSSVVPSGLLGTILIRAEANGEAYYVDPETKKLNFLSRPADAFGVMREFGLGISNIDFNRL